MSNIEDSKRSKLQNRDTITWMNRRYKDKVPLQYRTTPEEFKIHQIIQSIFQKFDEDKSSIGINRHS